MDGVNEAADDPSALSRGFRGGSGSRSSLRKELPCDPGPSSQHKGQECSTNESQTIPANIPAPAAARAAAAPGLSGSVTAGGKGAPPHQTSNRKAPSEL